MTFETVDLALVSAHGGANVNWNRVGEYIAPVLPFGTGAPFLNKDAAKIGMRTARVGQVAGGMAAGPPGALVGRAAGAAIGYYGALLYRDLSGQ